MYDTASAYLILLTEALDSSILIETLADNFDDNSLDTAKWTAFGNPPVTTTESSQQINITPGSNSTGYGGITSFATNYNLTASSAYVEVKAVTNSAESAAETQFIVEDDSTNRLFIGTAGTSLYTGYTVGGSSFFINYYTYSSTNDRWWRIREASGTIYWETSANGTSWNTKDTLSTPITITNVGATLQAGTYSNVAAPGTVIFDNFNTPPAATNTGNFFSLF